MEMVPSKRIVNYDDFTYIIDKICQHKSVAAVDTIICIGRGGYVPGTYISHKLKVSKVYTIVTKSYNDDNTRGDFQLIQAPTLNDEDQKILVVDDIVDSGITFREIKKWFSVVYPTKDVTFASLLWKEQSVFADVVYGAVAKPDSWVVFPWET